MTEKEPSAAELAYQKAVAVKQDYEQELLAKPNVVGVGVGLQQKENVFTNVIAIVVMVSHKLGISLLDEDSLIPSEIDGVPVDVQEVGEIKAE